MDKISYAVKINPGLIKRIRMFCEMHGVKQGFFVEKALREQLSREELAEDISDLKILRPQESSAIDFDEYIKKRKR